MPVLKLLTVKLQYFNKFNIFVFFKSYEYTNLIYKILFELMLYVKKRLRIGAV